MRERILGLKPNIQIRVILSIFIGRQGRVLDVNTKIAFIIQQNDECLVVCADLSDYTVSKRVR